MRLCPACYNAKATGILLYSLCNSAEGTIMLFSKHITYSAILTVPRCFCAQHITILTVPRCFCAQHAVPRVQGYFCAHQRSEIRTKDAFVCYLALYNVKGTGMFCAKHVTMLREMTLLCAACCSIMVKGCFCA
jgi:hypothetical protein